MSEAPAIVATYRREIGAGLARVWENVLDWEHLPWLHATSFQGVRLVDAGPDHWRGWVTTTEGRESMIDTRCDRPGRRYRVTTLDGAGVGSEVVTRLAPRGERATGIEVEFRVPGVDPERGRRIGREYVALYARLWSEDEAMMAERQRGLDRERERRAAPIGGAAGELRPFDLGDEAALRARLPLVVESHGRRFRIVDVGGRLLAHPTTCPHLGGPLGDGALGEGIVTCPWHGYRFELATGRNADGKPCAFGPAPRVAIAPDTRRARLVWCARHAPGGAS